MMERAENVVVKKTEAFADRIVNFLTKLTIALKEANETKFWLQRLYSASYLSESEYKSILDDNVEIIKLLTSITKTVKSNL